jgi:hypothetical protein
MIIKKHNISGATAVLLIDSTDTTNATQINLANVHATDAAAVDLYLTEGTSTYYIFKNVSIPAGSTMVVNGLELDFDREEYSLYVKLGAGGSTVDVITRY